MADAEIRRLAESINHPAHYGGDTTYEAIKVIEAWGLGFHDGNAAKYICRQGKKTTSRLEDLKKARWYLDRLIQSLESPVLPDGDKESPSLASARPERSEDARGSDT